MRSKPRFVLCLFIFCAATVPAAADTIVYRYTGTYTSLGATDPQELGGADFDLTWTVDSTEPAQFPSATSASYPGDLTLIITNSPGDVGGTYNRSDHFMIVSTDFNGFGYLSFGNVSGTEDSPVPNFGNFIILPLPRITFGVIADTSLPIGDFTGDLQGVWGTGTAGGGSYSATITELSGTLVPAVPGDLNGDGVVDGLDIDPFVQVLTGATPFNAAADLNDDDNVDGLDIDPFVQALTGGPDVAAVVIPEPTTGAALLALAALLTTRRRACAV